MKRLAIGIATAALLGTVFAATPAVAADSAGHLAGCITWYDKGGPGGAGRFHAKCAGTGVYVRTTLVCADGSSHTSAWRYEYQKSECPYGVAAERGYYGTTHG
ncbi:hypothetical protein ABT095_35010 [Kitasatospora sp. NPDC002227]|uniref:hypothetical protein n=1 Tax=Kitasatospora sp. NPDC002227 TaxID=3154773 RepID=UPI00332CD9BC